MTVQAEWIEQSRSAIEERLEYLRSCLTNQQPTLAGTRSNSALGQLIQRFGLTPFETDVLVAAAGLELDTSFAKLVASVHNTPRATLTVGLALSCFTQPHWSAFATCGVLRQGRLIRLSGETSGLADSLLHLEEAVLHYLNGVATDPAGFDVRLRPYVRPLRPAPTPATLQPAAEAFVRAWAEQSPDGRRRKPHLLGADAITLHSLAAGASAALDRYMVAVDVAALPSDRAHLLDLVELLERDCLLFDTAILFDTNGCDAPEKRLTAQWLASRVRTLAAFVGDCFTGSGDVGVVQIAVPRPSRQELETAWRDALGPAAVAQLNGQLAAVIEQFRLSPSMLDAAASEALASADGEEDKLANHVWDACRRRSRGGLDDIAHRVESHATWSSLVLPQPQTEILQSLLFSVRHRHRVRDEWGFERSSSRGAGTTALFYGPSGSGKTLASAVIANELQLDLYRIDLSAAVSKFVGETEKNLRRIFDSAESSGAVLLFDEADALFGKRSEVQSSHDRYANIEVSYLLQRLESYRGLAILTTNLRTAIDNAFLRRIQYVVAFPFPPAAERARIWRCAFPPAAPLDPSVDFERLSQLAVAGGNIANIALDAAYRAAAKGGAISMRHLLDAARAECAKIEKPLAEAEVRGWI
ncbi:ATPase [Bryobacterales bacterium F-183]|nr:ATPase [Bryobacterales bacterium F-183]